MSENAFIELDEDTHVRTIWIVCCDTFDVLGWMYRSAGKAWDIGYRFRFYRDDRAFNSDDEKRGWVITPSSAEPAEAELAEIASGIETALVLLAQHMRAKVQRLDLHCDGLAAALVIERQPWANRWYSGGAGGNA